jgi:hypothetical protein
MNFFSCNTDTSNLVNFSLNVLLHVFILFTFLSLFFSLYVSKLTENAFKDEIDNLIGNGVPSLLFNIPKPFLIYRFVIDIINSAEVIIDTKLDILSYSFQNLPIEVQNAIIKIINAALKISPITATLRDNLTKYSNDIPSDIINIIYQIINFSNMVTNYQADLQNLNIQGTSAPNITQPQNINIVISQIISLSAIIKSKISILRAYFDTKMWFIFWDFTKNEFDILRQIVNSPVMNKIKDKYKQKNEKVIEHNKWVLGSSASISIYMFIMFVIICIVLYFSCKQCIPLSSMLIENVIVFTIIGAIEILFFLKIAAKYVPVQPSLLTTTLIETLKNKFSVQQIQQTQPNQPNQVTESNYTGILS